MSMVRLSISVRMGFIGCSYHGSAAAFLEHRQISGGIARRDGSSVCREGGFANQEAAVDQPATQGAAYGDRRDGGRIADLATIIGEELVVERFHGIPLGRS